MCSHNLITFGSETFAARTRGVVSYLEALLSLFPILQCVRSESGDITRLFHWRRETKMFNRNIRSPEFGFRFPASCFRSENDSVVQNVFNFQFYSCATTVFSLTVPKNQRVISYVLIIISKKWFGYTIILSTEPCRAILWNAKRSIHSIRNTTDFIDFRLLFCIFLTDGVLQDSFE